MEQRCDKMVKYVEVFSDGSWSKIINYKITPDNYELKENEFLGTEKDYAKFPVKKEKISLTQAKAYATADKAKKELLSVSKLLEKADEQTDWLVKNMVVKQGITIIGGSPGCYKSFIAQHMALSVAHGKDWLGQFTTKKVSVLYVDEENGEVLLAKRYKQLLTGHEQTPPENLFSSVFQGLQLDKPEGEIHLAELITFTQAKLVIIDSMVRCMEGEEDKSSDVRQVFESLKGVKESTGCAVVVLHHLRKGDNGKKGMNDLRGSGDFPAMADVILLITNNSVSRKIKVTMAKNRYIPIADVKPFEITVTNPQGTEESINFTHSGVADEEKSIGEECLEELKVWIQNESLEEFTTNNAISYLGKRGYSKTAFYEAIKLSQEQFYTFKVAHGKYKVSNPQINKEVKV